VAGVQIAFGWSVGEVTDIGERKEWKISQFITPFHKTTPSLDPINYTINNLYF